MDNNELNKKIEQLGKDIKRMEVENLELFESFGTTPKELLQLLNDQSRMPKEVFEFLERQRKHLEEVLTRRIDAAQASILKKQTRFDLRPGGHWIFVR